MHFRHVLYTIMEGTWHFNHHVGSDKALFSALRKLKGNWLPHLGFIALTDRV